MVQRKCDRILRSNTKATMAYKFSNLSKLHRSPYYVGVKLWTNLPEEKACEKTYKIM